MAKNKKISVFDFDDYKSFIRAHLENLPKRGWGQYQKIADNLGVNSTLISQIFRGDKNLTAEQAVALTEYLGMSTEQSEYFVLLVQIERAGSYKLKRHYHTQLQRARKKGEKVSSRLKKTEALSELDQAVFYSDFHYSAVRMLCSLPEFKSADQIATKLGLSIPQVNDALEFLISRNLIVRTEAGYDLGKARTHISPGSPFLRLHHANWRGQATERFRLMKDDELTFTSTVSLSKKDFVAVREMILGFVEELGQKVEKSNSEEAAFLNIDWLRIGK